MAYPFEGWLVRNVEYETFKTRKKSVYQSALPLRSDAELVERVKLPDEGGLTEHPTAEPQSAGARRVPAALLEAMSAATLAERSSEVSLTLVDCRAQLF